MDLTESQTYDYKTEFWYLNRFVVVIKILGLLGMVDKIYTSKWFNNREMTMRWDEYFFKIAWEYALKSFDITPSKLVVTKYIVPPQCDSSTCNDAYATIVPHLF